MNSTQLSEVANKVFVNWEQALEEKTNNGAKARPPGKSTGLISPAQAHAGPDKN